MNAPKSYFYHEPRIKTEGQMMDALKRHVAEQPNKLHWQPPVKNKDGSGHQLAAGTDYSIRKTITGKAWLYWSWHNRKLLGYSADLEVAKAHCETHYINNQRCVPTT